jgi:hypothetical protein
VLESLGRKRTSGVLEVDGSPAGAIYLDRGQITFARASWVPDLTARLCGVLQPAPELRNLLRGSDQADRDIGVMLVERGFMARNELQSILRSAIIDALLALTTPLAGGSSVSDIRFEAPGVHWAAAFVRLPLESAQSEVARRAEQMSRAGVADTVPVALAEFDRGPAILTRDQWAIACRVNGSLTPRDLARQAGLPLYDTVTALGILLRRGLCTLATPVPPPPRTRTTPVAPDPHLSRTPDPRSGATAPAPRPSATPIPRPSATAPAPRRAEAMAASAPAWVPSPDELLSQHDTGPQANLAAPRDVPASDDGAPMHDPGVSRPARDGLTWGAHGGPAGPPTPGPADPPEPPATRSGAASIPADAGVPPVRRQPSFTPIVTPAPLTAPELASPQPVPGPVAEESVPSGAAPTAVVPPADVPIVRPWRRLPPAHPGYRRPPRPEWSTAAPPVPSAVLAAPAAVDSAAAARPPDPDEPAGAWRPLLPQRQPGAGLVQPPRNATAPMPFPARDWHRPEPAEPEAFGSTGPDLLRRVLDGLRRLT